MNLLFTRGAQGAEVARVRRALAAQLGQDATAFAGLAQGNTFDATAEAAARRWQSGVGLVADGVIGPRCLQALGLLSAAPMAVELALSTVQPLFPATKPANIERNLPYVAAALGAMGLTDRPMVCAALGTIRAESEGFVPIPEFISAFNTAPGGPPFGRYEGRKDLGNRQAGDGARFKGRGFVQLTGRANYETYGAQLGVDLASDTAHADLANAPEVAALLLAAFLAAHAPALRTALAAGDFAAARKLVNGGAHGLDRFKDVFKLADRAWPAAQPAAPRSAKRTAGSAHKRSPAAATPAGHRARRSLAVRKDSADLRDRAYLPPPVGLLAAFPTDADVRALLPSYTAAGLILDQGQEGACTGFGLACVVNHLRWRQAGMPKKMDPVSPRMLYTFARRYDEYEGEDYDGSSCRGALKGWYHHGVCLEADWPYADPHARPAYGYAQRATRIPLGVYFRVALQSITDLQAAIQQVGAVYVSAFTHAGWDDVPTVRKALKGHADLPVIAFDGKPSQATGHAFALVGFNEHGFVLQNSWGRDWGAGGFAVLTYADWLANGMDAWVVALGVPGVVAGRINAAGSGASAAAGRTDTRLWWSEDRAYQHSVVLGNDGRVRRYLTEDELTRTLLHQVAGLPDQWFRSLPAQAPKRLVIYAHGGLNSEADAIARARAMGRHFEANGCYPLFMVWKTGLFESIGNILAEAWRRQPSTTGAREWLTERTDLLVEKTVGRPFAKPLWSEMKENAGLAFGTGRGGDLLLTALQKLRDTWGDALEIHLMGHSAGSILLGHLLSAAAARQADAALNSVHLYAPACTVPFANQHYAPHTRLMKQLHIDLLSDRVERNDSVAGIYRKSLLYLVSNALEADLRTPILGLQNVFDAAYAGWDGSAATNEALRTWRAAAQAAGLPGSGRLGVVDDDRMLVALPNERIPSSHGGFDNDLAVVSRTLQRITGAPLKAPVDDLRGF